MAVAALLLWRGKLYQTRWVLWLLMLMFPCRTLPIRRVDDGEMGRQPWLVYGLMRTRRAFPSWCQPATDGSWWSPASLVHLAHRGAAAEGQGRVPGILRLHRGNAGGCGVCFVSNVLPASTDPSYSLTIYNTATGEHGMRVGFVWWGIGMVLAAVYFVFVYRMFRGKVRIEEGADGHGY